MLKIGEFSKLSRISIRMLRHYDEIGLLTPAETDPFTAYRHYGEDQLAVAGKIVALRDMGFGLSAIGEILKRDDDKNALIRCLRLKQMELEEQREAVSRQIHLLQTAVNRLRKDETAMRYQVILKDLPERYVASVRKILDSYEDEGLLWQILMSETAPLHMTDGEPCYAIAIFHDKEFRETDVGVEVQKSVKGRYADTPNVTFKTEPPVTVASITYKGSYEQMNGVNEAVAAWIRDNGYSMVGPAFDIYHISPHETQNPDELVTDVCYPVRKI